LVKKIEYIKGRQELGIKYDWKEIRKRYRALNCPAIFYNPCVCPFESCKYFVEFSQRSIGKTTNWLLLGMIMYTMYGTKIQYLRQSEEQIMPKVTRNMFDPILENGYIDKITEGRWNHLIYKSRRWYFAKTDNNGNIVEECPDHFCMMMSVKDNEKYKSGYNAPTGDLIIFDEFISKWYYPDEFVCFCDLVKTIIRDRLSPIVVMLANNTDKESAYFNEMEIYDEVRMLNPSEHLIKVTAKGTAVYVEYISADKEKKQRLDILNKLFFGFKNKKLGSITGEDWALSAKQHIPEGKIEVISRNLYIFNNSRLVRLDLVMHEHLGICMYAHWASRTYDDSYILTIEDRTDNRYHYRLGHSDIDHLIRGMINTNRIYYATNDIYPFIENYFMQCQKKYF